MTDRAVVPQELLKIGKNMAQKVVRIQKDPNKPGLSLAIVIEFLPQSGDAIFDPRTQKTIFRQVDKFAVLFDSGCGGPILPEQIKFITDIKMEDFSKQRLREMYGDDNDPVRSLNPNLLGC